jgi:hypothetical protein
MDWLEQLEAFAVRVKGEETVLLLYGLLTVGLASAGTAATTVRTAGRESKLRSFIRDLLNIGAVQDRVPVICFVFAEPDQTP